jgi:hypothetical protein
MSPRNQRSSQERVSRSRAVQLLADKPLLRGSLVLQYRSCGKSYCRCQRGQKHPALYLYTRSGDRRIRTYIPPALHDTVRTWIESGHQIDHLVDRVSEHNLQTLLKRKQEVLASKRPPQPEGQSS